MFIEECSISSQKNELFGKLENSLFPRRIASPIPTQTSWEREMVRGYVHSFADNYRLQIRSLSGQDETVVVKEDTAMIATRVWDCAVLTTKWLEHMCVDGNQIPDITKALHLRVNPAERPVQVLELGAGTGLLSICLAKMGAAVLSTEYGPTVKYLENNCKRNNVLPEWNNKATMIRSKVRCRELDWFNATENLTALFAPDEQAIFDLLIVTDCSLSKRETCGVFDMIRKYSTTGHTRVIVGSCLEREGTPLMIEMAKDFKNFQQIGTSSQHPSYSSSKFSIVIFDA